MSTIRNAKYQIGQVVRHRIYPFRGVVFDIDPVFANTEEWYQAIPVEVRPHKDQPFYHLFAENDDTEYVAYVSEQNLLPDTSGEPLRHPQVAEVFIKDGKGGYRPRAVMRHYSGGALKPPNAMRGDVKTAPRQMSTIASVVDCAPRSAGAQSLAYGLPEACGAGGLPDCG